MLTIAIAILVLVLVIGGMYVSYRASKKSFGPRMMDAVGAVQAATCQRLIRRYADFGEGGAMLLSAAITNELFDRDPVNDVGIYFRKENHDLIAQHLSELKDDMELLVAVTQAIRVLAAIENSEKSREMPRIVSHFQKLDDLGILVPGGEAPRASTFVAMAKKYYQSNCHDPKSL